MNYEYGYAWKGYPVDDYTFPDGSRIKCHNIFDETPAWMKEADLLFVDPPWTITNLRTFYTKAGMVLEDTFPEFYKRLFEVIGEIDPVTVYVEVGKDFLAEFIIELKKQYKYVTFFNSSYYHNDKNKCYVIRGSKRFKKPAFCKDLDGMDEEDIIKCICEQEVYKCIADPCMGQGLVAFYAHAAGKRFVGAELNHKRLAVCRKRIETGKL